MVYVKIIKIKWGKFFYLYLVVLFRAVWQQAIFLQMAHMSYPDSHHSQGGLDFMGLWINIIMCKKGCRKRLSTGKDLSYVSLNQHVIWQWTKPDLLFVGGDFSTSDYQSNPWMWPYLGNLHNLLFVSNWDRISWTVQL